MRYSSDSSYEPDASGCASLLQQQQQQLAGPDSWGVLFDGLEAEQPAVTVSSTLLDFGCCSRLSPAELQSFQVGTKLACAASCEAAHADVFPPARPSVPQAGTGPAVLTVFAHAAACGR